MRHLDLFSGIGGFSLAAQWVWGDKHEILAFCECDLFCQKVLKKHWPSVPIVSDIHDMRGDEYGAVDLISGGPPCQPASVAGKQGGTKDDRWLWPETFKVVRAVRPRWCIFENVRGILNLEGGMVFDSLLSELEAIGYEVWPFIIPACATDAPHRRDRVWIVAHADTERKLQSQGGQQEQRGWIGDSSQDVADTENAGTIRGKRLTRYDKSKSRIRRDNITGSRANDGCQDVADAKEAMCQQPGDTWSGRDGFTNCGQDVSDPNGERCQKQWIAESDESKLESPELRSEDTPDSSSTGLEGQEPERRDGGKQGLPSECCRWLPEPPICELDDGIFDGLVRYRGRVTTDIPNRIAELRALGNAIVPQVAAEIMQAMKE